MRCRLSYLLVGVVQFLTGLLTSQTRNCFFHVFFCDIFLVIWQYARTRIFADFRQYEGLLPQTSGELLAPKRFLNVWTCAWFCGFATIFWGKETTYKMFSQLQSTVFFFEANTHSFTEKNTWFAIDRGKTWAISVPQLYWKASLVVVQSRLASLSSLFAAVVSKI